MSSYRGQTIREAEAAAGGLVIEWSNKWASQLGVPRTYGFANGGRELAERHIDEVLDS